MKVLIDRLPESVDKCLFPYKSCDGGAMCKFDGEDCNTIENCPFLEVINADYLSRCGWGS